jgi:hypothetical protein
VIEPALLVADLQQWVRELEHDLLSRAESAPEMDKKLRERHRTAENRSRTGLSFEAWRTQQLTQVAAGWVLACVFTRFCEDNDLLPESMLAGPGDRLAEARERQLEYFRQHQAHSDLEYLQATVHRLTRYEPTRALADRQNPMHLLALSPDRATELLEFWRRIEPETGKLRHDFTDPGLSTRFLGDLYQDLSPQAQVDYALKQTPEFVEEFILDRTLDPAIREFGLAYVKLIDPACGSGHFLLGAFARLLARWRDQEPGTNVRVLAERGLGQVNGVDINPYAAAIARFRLVVAALAACEIKRLADCPAWHIPVAIGDSLRFGVMAGQLHLEGVTEEALAGTRGEGEFIYEYEDAIQLQAILGQRYHAVVANPPYITVKDPILNGLYRELWSACSGKYHLSVPFSQRIYDLAVDSGFTGQITDSAFMKATFGRKLIEQFYASVDLNLVIDTSGVYIPGHGTPTAIICGRNRRPVKRTVRAVLGIRGEPNVPADPAEGKVWTSIIENIDGPGTPSEWITVTDLDRSTLAKYPWSLSGGGASDLLAQVERSATGKLQDRSQSVGITSFTLEDDVYVRTRSAFRRAGAPERYLRTMVLGDEVRDWAISAENDAIFPYDEDFNPVDTDVNSALRRVLWPYRTNLSNNIMFGKQTKVEAGLKWTEYGRLTASKLRTPMSIAFAFVATHNHFVLDHGGKVFNRPAPVIKLLEGATGDEHLALIGVLNSSTACFWLRQRCGAKGGSGIGRGIQPELWMERYSFNSSNVEQFPLPAVLPLERARGLDSLGAKLQTVTPSVIAASGMPTRATLDAARVEWERIRGEMISAQEELDWEVYGLYGLLGDETTSLVSDGTVPALRLGERAFEIVLARKRAGGEVETEWLARHRSTPITEILPRWPAEYRALVQRRLEKIASDPYLHLIERQECKRRWVTDSWEQMEREALRDWLCDRLEDRALWFRPDPGLRSIAQLADALRIDADFVTVAGLYMRDADLTDVVLELVGGQHVPFLAALRYTESGIRVRREWERTWELQRQEDAGKKVGDIPVPYRYKQGDFRDQAYWRNRGKLDVPKERFISYPECSRDGTLLLGWAGFDFLQQAQALATYIGERRELDAWDAVRLTPLLAGLAELMPWLGQWHGEVDPAFGQSPADAYAGFLDQQLLSLRLTSDDLTAWKPQPPARGRRAGRRAAP